MVCIMSAPMGENVYFLFLFRVKLLKISLIKYNSFFWKRNAFVVGNCRLAPSILIKRRIINDNDGRERNIKHIRRRSD